MKLKIKKVFFKYYPFWLGLILCIFFIGYFQNTPTIAVFAAFIMGYYKTTKLHE